MEEHLQRGRALIPRIRAGNGDAQRVERGVRTGCIGDGAHVDPNFFTWPLRLVNVRQPVRQTDALLAHQRSRTLDPCAVSSVIGGPAVGVVDGRRALQNLRQLRRQPGVAGFFLRAGKFVASFKIAQLILQQHELRAEQQILVSVIRRVVRDRVIPRPLLGARERDLCTRRDLQDGFARPSGLCAPGGSRAPLLPRFFIQPVMEIDPEAAVQFEDRKRSVDRVNLRSGSKRRWKKQREDNHQYRQACRSGASHGEVPDGNANCARAQMRIGASKTRLTGKTWPPRPASNRVPPRTRLHSMCGSTSLPTAPWRSAPCKPPLVSRKNERRPVRPYVSGVAANSYFAGAPRLLPPEMT